MDPSGDREAAAFGWFDGVRSRGGVGTGLFLDDADRALTGHRRGLAGDPSFEVSTTSDALQA